MRTRQRNRKLDYGLILCVDFDNLARWRVYSYVHFKSAIGERKNQKEKLDKSKFWLQRK